ncbi:MAG: winged helix-turn-helix domain-containing protein [Desulfurococcales archaeon]|nr:winged helix-turn-helix domain-containing protein [Desulfurococcales archaeon]
MHDEDEVKLIAAWLIEGSRGGITRARILLLLKDKPLNPHQISSILKLNYRTVTHHLEVLAKNGLVRRLSNGYGAPYTLTRIARSNWSIIEEYIRRVDSR